MGRHSESGNAAGHTAEPGNRRRRRGNVLGATGSVIVLTVIGAVLLSAPGGIERSRDLGTGNSPVLRAVGYVGLRRCFLRARAMSTYCALDEKIYGPMIT
jgi:hypothetical protein